MAHYSVIFHDKYYGTHINHFETFEEAQQYWNDYADAETCLAGKMVDLDTDETIWEFED